MFCLDVTIGDGTPNWVLSKVLLWWLLGGARVLLVVVRLMLCVYWKVSTVLLGGARLRKEAKKLHTHRYLDKGIVLKRCKNKESPASEFAVVCLFTQLWCLLTGTLYGARVLAHFIKVVLDWHRWLLVRCYVAPELLLSDGKVVLGGC